MKKTASAPPVAAPRKRATGGKPVVPGFVDDYLANLLGLAANLIMTEFHAIVAQHDLSPSEWRVLATVASVPDGEDCSMARLMHFTGAKQPTLTRLLDRMVEAGHVERMDAQQDRRVTLMRLSPKGNMLVRKLINLAQAHEARVLEPLGPAAGESLKKVLKRLIELHR